MARLFIDGFETGDTRCWDGVYNYAVAQTASVRPNSGAYCCNLTQGSYGYLRKDISPATPNTIFFKLYWYFQNNPGNATEMVMFSNSQGNQISLCWINGTLSVRKGGAGDTVLATVNVTFATGNWYLVEGKFILDASVGVAQIKLSGQLVIDFSGNTHKQTSDTITSVWVGPVTFVTNGPNPKTDDIVLDDANWIGDGSILPLIPNGAGGVTQLTPSSGNNYACVNPVPATDAQNVSSNTPNSEDTYTKATVGTTWTVKCVQMSVRSQSQGAPACGGIEPMLRIAGTDYPGVRTAVPIGSYGNAINLWQVSPATSAAFTISELNSLEIGARLVA